jgi:hypothetical protein
LIRIQRWRASAGSLGSARSTSVNRAAPDVPADHHVDDAGAIGEADAAGKRVVEVPLQQSQSDASLLETRPALPHQCAALDRQEVHVGRRPARSRLTR